MSCLDRTELPCGGFDLVCGRRRFDVAVAAVVELRPTLLLSSHGVAAVDRTDLLLVGLRVLPGMDPYVPPDQAAFEHLKTEMGG